MKIGIGIPNSIPGTGGRLLLEWARRNNAWIIEDDYDTEFRYVDRPRRLVFTWSSQHAGEDTRVTLDFKAQQDRTLLTLTHERLPSKEAIAMHHQGWSEILDKLTPIFS